MKIYENESAMKISLWVSEWVCECVWERYAMHKYIGNSNMLKLLYHNSQHVTWNSLSLFVCNFYSEWVSNCTIFMPVEMKSIVTKIVCIANRRSKAHLSQRTFYNCFGNLINFWKKKFFFFVFQSERIEMCLLQFQKWSRSLAFYRLSPGSSSA